MKFQLNTDQVNYLNVTLMLLSAALAYRYPFELFLFAYAVMGPLHYLTEISWLHDRHYYTQGKKDYFFLVGASIVVTVIFFNWVPSTPRGAVESLTFLAFGGALSFAFVKNTAVRWAALLPTALAAFLFSQSPFYLAVFGIFLPTLIHVFLFTGLFILVGALRGKSASGLISLGVFLGVALSFIFFHPHGDYAASDYVRNSYGYFKDDGTASSPFVFMNFYLAKVFQIHDFGTPALGLVDFVRGANDFLYRNPLALSLMSFVAFAYTYHYFNWFSKTSIIGWHEIPKSRAAVILVIWLLSLGLYAYDYSVGLRWLFFLSFTHVLLEFPLNHLTAIGISRQVWKMLPLARAMEAKK